MTTLSERIEQAQAAREQLDEQRALEQQAAELPDLLAEKEMEQELQAAEAGLGHVAAWAKREFAEAAQEATDWRERFQSACTELEALAAELPKVQQKIFGAGRQLHQATQEVNSVGFIGPDPTSGTFAQGTSYALQQGRGVSFEALLAQCGGGDHRLNVWPQAGGDSRAEVASLRQAVRKLIRKRTRTMTYEPHLGAKQF